jgi:hypothetical protein
MKSSKRVYLLALVVAVVLVVIVGSRFLYKTEVVAHTVGIQAWQAEMQGKPNAVAWKHEERPITTVNSKFNLDLPPFSPDTDWVVGVKPVNEGEKERMYAGVVTWEDAIDKEGKAKGLGFKKVSKIEDYPQQAVSFLDGAASFANVLNGNQTLVIYLEVRPLTEIDVTQNGKAEVLKASEGSSIIFDGEKESVQITGPASLLNEMHIRKLKKEVDKAGHSMRIEAKEKMP